MEIEAWRGNVELKMIQADPAAATLAHHELGRNVDKHHIQCLDYVILNIYTKMDTFVERNSQKKSAIVWRV